MDNKELMELILEHSENMKEWGHQNGVGFLDSPKRIKAMSDSLKTIAKIERELEARDA